MPLVPVDLLAATNLGFAEYNLLLAAARAALYSPIPLGGSSSQPHPGTAYEKVLHANPFQVPSAVEATGTWKARVYLKCEDAAVTITPKIRNLTDASDAVVGSACSGTADDYSGTNQNQLLTFTPAVGKLYELQAIKSADAKECFCIGTIARTDS